MSPRQLVCNSLSVSLKIGAWKLGVVIQPAMTQLCSGGCGWVLLFDVMFVLYLNGLVGNQEVLSEFVGGPHFWNPICFRYAALRDNRSSGASESSSTG